MIKLRPYQQDLLQQAQTALAADAKARVMMQLPTGGGKTIIAGASARADWLLIEGQMVGKAVARRIGLADAPLNVPPDGTLISISTYTLPSRLRPYQQDADRCATFRP